MITRTRTLLKKWYEGMEEVVFRPELDSGGVEHSVSTLTLTRAMWDELGSPVELTVTLEPGDKLNEDPG